MADTKHENVMAILEDECAKELECAKITKEMMKRTLNPFKYAQLKKSWYTFICHSIGIQLAIRRLAKYNGEKSE